MPESISILNKDYLDSLIEQNKIYEFNEVLKSHTPVKSTNMKMILDLYLNILVEQSIEKASFYKYKDITEYLDIYKDHYLIQNLSSIDINNFFSIVFSSNKGHNILKILKKKNNYDLQIPYKNYLEIVAKSGTLPNLIFCIQEIIGPKTKVINFFEIMKGTLSTERIDNIIFGMSSNNDDRVFKYMFKELGLGITYNNKIKDNIERFIINIFSPTKPDKYILKRIKILSEYIDLKDYFHLLIKFFHGDISTLEKIYKFYYNENFLLSLEIKDNYYNKIIFSNVFYNYIFDKIFFNKTLDEIKNIYDRLYNLQRSDYERNVLKMNMINFIGRNLSYDTIDLSELYEYINFEYIKDEKSKEIFNSKISYVFDDLYIFDPYFHYNNNKDNKIINRAFNSATKFLKFFSKEEIEKYISSNKKLKSSREFIILMLPFMNYNKEYKEINKTLFYLKVFIRMYKNKTKLINRFRMRPILNEIKNMGPSSNKAIFKRETYNYKLKKQKFNFIPPYTILPNQIQNINYDIFLKEKTDGITVNNIPSKIIFPSINFKESIKAEYVEDLDLYLVFDIDLDLSIKDRYDFLRSTHPFTKDFRNNGKSIKEMINLERENLNKFLSQDYDSYRWYPKAAYQINTNSNEFKDLMINVINNDDIDTHKWLCNDQVPNDGFIITPLNGNREIKVKPKSLLTLDLKFVNGDWLDRDNTNYNDIVVKNEEIFLENNTIWRLYPILEDLNNILYQPREFRSDKLKPNPRLVVNNLISLCKIKYTKKVLKNVYLSDNRVFTFTNFWKNIMESNKSNIIKMLRNHKNINSWLDLGCGNGKNIKLLNKYDSYYGIDIDRNQLIKSVEKYQYKNNVYNYLDLSKDWNLTKNKWLKFDFNKYQNILAINSLMHFCNDIFWSQLNKVSEKGTVFTFNLVNDNLTKKYDGKYEFHLSYIEKVNSKTNYKFAPVHTSNMEEPFISKEIILGFFEKYKWEVIEEYTDDNNDFTNLYTWYSIVKV